MPVKLVARNDALEKIAEGILRAKEAYGENLKGADLLEAIWIVGGRASQHVRRERVAMFLASTGAMRKAEEAANACRAIQMLMGRVLKTETAIMKLLKEIKNEKITV